jgi:hypothetical protein
VKEGGWAELLDELLAKVLELLQVAGQAGGLGFVSSQGSRTGVVVAVLCQGGPASPGHGARLDPGRRRRRKRTAAHMSDFAATDSNSKATWFGIQ